MATVAFVMENSKLLEDAKDDRTARSVVRGVVEMEVEVECGGSKQPSIWLRAWTVSGRPHGDP